MAAHRAPPSLGFSRQEHLSGLPFPSPMHESEKWKWSHLVMYDTLRPYGLQTTRLLRLELFKSHTCTILITMNAKCMLPNSKKLFEYFYSLQCRRPRFDPWVGKILWRRKWQPTPVHLLGKSHGRRSIVGYSPWGHKELDTTEQLHSLTHSQETIIHVEKSGVKGHEWGGSLWL